jgi:hypothetical protein
MLQNRIYRGEIVHQGTAYSGQQKAIIDPKLLKIVHDKLAGIDLVAGLSEDESHGQTPFP